MTLGTFGVLTLNQARAQARAELAKVEMSKADPLAERERARQGETVSDLCRAYMERHGNTKKSGPDDQRRIDRHILPAWRSLKVIAITRADVARLHSRIGKATPYEANRTLSLLSKMFNLAKIWGFLPDTQANPAHGIDRFREVKRDRWVAGDDLPHLAKAINEEPNQSARTALWLYLLTGARKTELLTARWDQIDWTRGELRLPDTKAKRIHYIPLSAPALELLRETSRIEGCPYILPGRPPAEPGQPHGHLVNISKPWNRVRHQATIAIWRQDPNAAALIDRLAAGKTEHIPTLAEIRAAAQFPLPPGLDDVRLHDLRRTVGSWLAQAGNSLHLIGRVLNHSSTSTTAIYARFGEDAVRAALEQHGARIMGAAGMTPEAEVTEIKTRRKT